MFDTSDGALLKGNAYYQSQKINVLLYKKNIRNEKTPYIIKPSMIAKRRAFPKDAMTSDTK